MNRALLVVFRLLALLSGSVAMPLTGARAQQPAATAARPVGVNVSFKDGKQILGTGFRFDGVTLLVTQQVGAGTGEIGYPLAAIDKVEFPEPPQIAGSLAQIAQGKDGEALTQIDPVVVYYGPLRTVPGNWWLPAALVRLDALAGLRRERDVDVLLAEVARLTANPVAVEAVRLRTAEALVRRGTPDKAEKIFDEIIKGRADDDFMARAWIGKGRALLSRKEFEPALLAYLHVPVFYPDNRRQLSDAMLGSGRAFAGLDNRDKARETFQQIINDDPLPRAPKMRRLSWTRSLPVNPHPLLDITRYHLFFLFPPMKSKYIYLGTVMAGALLLAVASAIAQSPAPVADPAHPAETHVSLFHTILEGGWVMVPIGLCSIFMLYLVGDGIIRTGQKKTSPPQHEAAIKDLFRQGDYVGAYNFCKANRSPMTNVLRTGLSLLGEGKQATEEGMLGELAKENAQLQTWISYLSVIGVCAPMIGLLGTVTGMIKAFAKLGSSGIGDPSGLAAAIGEVLVATASGLIIAIPAFMAFYFLRNRAAGTIHSIQDVIADLFRMMPYEAMAGVHIGDKELYAALPNWLASAPAATEAPLAS